MNEKETNKNDKIEEVDEIKDEIPEDESVIQDDTDVEEFEKDGQETKLLNTIDEADVVLSNTTDDNIENTDSNNLETDKEFIESEERMEETTYIESPITEEELAMEDEVDYEPRLEQTKAAASNIFGKAMGCIGNAIFSVFILAMVFIIVMNAASFVKGKEPSVFGYKMYVIGEDSMNPTIRKNDAIIVKETDSSQLHVGDLITYTSKSGNEVITGWVTEIFDNNRLEVKKKMSSDQSVIIDGVAVIGLATYRIANMGEFIEFISHPIGIGTVLIVGIIIYIIMWLIGRRRSQKNIN